MFNIGGFSPLGMIAQVGLGAMTGGTSLLLQTALRAVVSAIGQQVIQQIGDKMGLPQGMIDIAQGAFAQSVGDTKGANRNYREAIQSASQGLGGTPAEAGAATAQADNIAQTLTNIGMDGVKAAREKDGQAAVSGAKGGSLLMRIAIALGSQMDKKMEAMDLKTTQIGGLGTIDSKNQSKMGQLTGELQGLGQELGMLSNALANTIKSLGEAGTTLARKG